MSFPNVVSFTSVMDHLSKHGHAELLPQVLALIKNDAWLASGEIRLALWVLLCEIGSVGVVV